MMNMQHVGAGRVMMAGVVVFLAACEDSQPVDADASVDAWMAVDAGADVPMDAGDRDASLFDGAPSDVAVTPDDAATHAWLLSETGLFEDGVGGPYAEGVRSYGVRFPLWTDGAEKSRHIILPPDTQLDTSNANSWEFPVGTRIFKEFIVDGVPIETRLIWKIAEGEWSYVSYLYREDGTDAEAIPEGRLDARATSHDVPNQEECRRCHRGSADFVLGIGSMQLDDETWDAWTAEGVLPSETVRGQPPGDATEQAALGYLHSNCGHCHNEIHPTGGVRPLRLWLPVGIEAANDAPAWRTTAGAIAFHDIGGTRTLVVPGDAEQSQLWVRMGVRDETQMPSLGTERVDERALEVIRAWIDR